MKRFVLTKLAEDDLRRIENYLSYGRRHRRPPAPNAIDPGKLKEALRARG